MVQCIIDWLFSLNFNMPLSSNDTERGHGGGRSRTMLICFEHYRLKGSIFRALQNVRNLKYGEATTEIFQDISLATALHPYTSALKEVGTVYRQGFLLKLIVQHKGKTRLVGEPAA